MTSLAASPGGFVRALLPVAFAALMALFGKLALASVNSDMATLMRTAKRIGIQMVAPG